MTMRNSGKLLFGFGIVFLAGGLAACAPGSAPRRSPSATGFGATTGDSSGAAGTGSPFIDIFPPTPVSTGIAGAAPVPGPVMCGPDGMPVSGAVGGGRMGFPTVLPTSPTQAAKPVPPISGGTLLALKDGKTVVAADPDRDALYVVDLGSNTVSLTFSFNGGDEPGRLIQDAAGRVHVALRRGGALVTIDPMTGFTIARRDVCSAPRGVAYQADGDLVHVACAGGELVSLPAAGGAITRTLVLDRDLRDVVVGTGGKLYVSTFRRADVLVVGTDGVVAKRARPANSTAINLMGGQARKTSPAVAWRMVPYDATTGTVVMLHQMGVDDEINPAFGGYSGIKGCSAIVEAGTSVLAPDSDATVVAPTGFEMVSLAVDVALSPNKSQIALAVPANSAVMGMPTIASGPMTQITGSTTGGGCTFLSNTNTGMQSPPPGEVVAVSFASENLLLAQVRNPATLWRSDTGVQIKLSTEDRTDTGHLLFHMNAGGGLACASCHPEGGEDGRVWNFACIHGRRTQSIRGKISGTAPFHWDGGEKTFSTLMDDVFVQRMSGPQLTEDFKSTLAGWIDTIPAMPVTRGLDAAAVERGKAVFNDTKSGCATCHAGTLLTNNTTIDVGTGGMLQVPSLRGVAWRAPFMHNGCAKTLSDRFVAACGGGDKHGVTSMLTPAQVTDLTTYLQSL
jgi:mono/diheme cytochrome c family protein